ncbi:MAG TPA: DUF2589 domain-containing protein [Bacteroidia bacterium]|nr:DUF2589 domain-containing protein [Bacteroidia bacterium]
MANFQTKTLDPSDYSGSDIAAIIGAPLVAAAHANAMMAREQIKFLMSFCFSKTGEVYEPVMIRMSMTKGVLTPSDEKDKPPFIQQLTTTFEIPLLTVIPINSLAVQSMEVNFDLEVTSHINVPSSRNSPGNLKPDHKSVRMMGKISSSPGDGQGTDKDYYDKTGASTLKVNIKSGPLPLPKGLASVLEVYSKNIHPVELNPGADTAQTDKK